MPRRLMVLMLFVSMSLSAAAEVILFSDSFNRANNTNIDALSTGMSGSLSPLTYVEIGDDTIYPASSGTGLPYPELTQVKDNTLYMAYGSNMTTMYLDHNFTDAAILADGGMKIGLTILDDMGPGATEQYFVGFGVGNTLQQCQATWFDHNGTGFRGQINTTPARAGTSDLWIGWNPANSGTIQVFKNGPTAAGGNNYNLLTGVALAGSDRLELELFFDSFADGSTVNANILWNGSVVGAESFTWDADGLLENYIGINARQGTGYVVDDLTIETASGTPDPTISQFAASPSSVQADNTAAQITLSWNADVSGSAITYEITADKPVVFPNNDAAGNAVNGADSVVAGVNGSLGDVEFTLTLYRNSQAVASGTVLVDSVPVLSPNAPNVIVIMLDDTGWSDIGCYGSEIQTPNIDSLAAGGVRFRNFYQAARCAPSRIALMSGLYTQQGATSPGAALPPLRKDNNITMAELLAQEDYRTYMAGKWHLGLKADGRDPLSRGFMHVFGQGVNVDGSNNSSAFGYWQEGDYHLVSTNNEISERQYGSQGLQFHYTDAVGDYGVDFIDHHLSKGDGKPFFLYMPINAAHWPVCAPAELANRYTDVGDPNPQDTDICLYESGWDVIRNQKYQRQLAMGVIDSRFALSPKGDHPEPPTAIPDWDTLDTNRKLDLARRQAVYAAMLEQADQNIGKIINKLTQEGLLNNTLIFFCCDNGANYEGGLFGNTSDPGGSVWNPDHLDSMGQPQNAENSSYPRVNQGGGWANMSNTPFRLFKHFTHDGGIRTSAILYWPAATDPSVRGTWTEQRGHLIDVMATVVDATQSSYPTAFNGHPVLPMEGTSLLEVLHGQAIASRDIGLEHEQNRALFRGDYKLTTKNFTFTDGSSPAHEIELYDLSVDPTELNNLADTEQPLRNEMIEGWNAWALRVGVPSDRLLVIPPPVINLPDPNYANAFFQDLFTRPNNYDIDADSAGMSGSLLPMAYIESFEGSGAGSIQIQGNDLQMATGVGMASMYLDHNFIDASIIDSGGFTVMLDILEISGGDSPMDRFGGFGVGLTQSQAAAAGDIIDPVTLRPYVNGPTNAVCDFYIDLAMDGVLRAWNGNTLLSEIPVLYTSGRIRVDFLLSGFLEGNTVIARIYFNEEQKDIVAFTWDAAGQNYIGLSARATNYVRMDNLVVMPFEDFSVGNPDLTGEGDVNLNDFAILATHWLNGYTVPCPRSDLSGDCYVDLKDLEMLAVRWLIQD